MSDVKHDNPFARLGERASLLYELGCAFAERKELDELVPLVMAKCRDVLDAEGASVLLLDVQRNELYFPYVAQEDATAAAQLRELRFPADQGIAGAVLQGGRSIRVDDAASDPRFYSGVDHHTRITTRALLSVPLRGRLGAIGVIQVLNPVSGGCFTDDDLAFLEALAGSVSVAIENARFYAQLREQVAALERAVHEHHELLTIRRELDIARNIQQSILPRTFPPFAERHDFEIFAEMIPAREVGGDFYDFFLIDDERLGLVIGDVSGKGVPAALFMAVTRTLLKSTALTGLPPAACLQRVNSLLCLENASEMFVTLFYGILHTGNGRARVQQRRPQSALSAARRWVRRSARRHRRHCARGTGETQPTGRRPRPSPAATASSCTQTVSPRRWTQPARCTRTNALPRSSAEPTGRHLSN